MNSIIQSVATGAEDRLWYCRRSDLFAHSPESLGEDGAWFAAPYTVCVELSRHCNFRCKLCISDSSPDHEKGGEWVSKALTDIFEAFGAVRIVWSGGEPTLHPNLKQQIQASHELGNANVLVTNASNFIGDAAVDWIDISIYGHSKESVRDFTGVPIFGKIMRNLRLYCSEYERVSASFVLGAHSFAAIKAMIDMAINAGVTRLKFHRLSRTGRNELVHQIDDGSPEAALIQDYLRDLKVEASFSRTSSSEHKRRGYWVAKPPGILTNSEESIALPDKIALANGVNRFNTDNKTIFS